MPPKRATSAKPAAPKPVRASKRKASDEVEENLTKKPKTVTAAPKAPKKAAPVKKPAATKKAAATKSAATKPAATKKTSPAAEPVAESKAPATKAPEKIAAVKKTAAAATPAAAKKTAPTTNSKKRKSPSDDEDEEKTDVEEPKAKKVKAGTAKAPKKAAAPKKEVNATKKPAPKKASPKPKPAPKPAKALPVINTTPTQILNVYVFGEGSAGELGLGAKSSDGKKVIDVTRPRLNPRLSAKEVGVVQIAVGGMHCAALTHDNKILTWGVNDQGALGRETAQEGKMKDIKANGESEDSDSDDEDSGLNPSEAEPREVDPKHFPECTKFATLVAGDSTTFALTTTGLVYGWGTFRANDGILGFRQDVKVQATPLLIPELKNVTSIACGTNHVLAITKNGKCFTWGAGEQSQLARRVVARTASGALVPREFGLGRKKVVRVGCGDYHSFAVDDKGDVYSWGLNSFGQTGVSKSKDAENDSIGEPTKVDILKGFELQQITGGAHHTLACTKKGEVLVWGRIDNKQGGVDVSKIPKDHVFFDENEKPRYLVKPLVIPDIKGAYVATGVDTCIAVDDGGKAYSWGFSTNYQTGQGSDEDVVEARHIDNTAVRGKKLVFAGVGGQFGVLGGIHEEAVLTNGV